MASTIPVIVQGNSFSLAIPLQIYYINGDQMDLEDYTPDPTDEVSIQLKGSRRNYTYTPSITDNIAYIDLSGNELADNYGVVVSIVKADGQRLRSFRTDQFFIVESSDDLTPADIIEGLEENVIYLNSSIFVAGEDGRGITSIVKTSTAGLVDTYTITYSDNTTSTFDVTNGAAGEDGATIASVEKTATVGKVDTYTITMTNGSTFDFEVTNGLDGVDLGVANIVNDLTTGGATNVLSAEQGKSLGYDVFSGDYTPEAIAPTLEQGSMDTNGKFHQPSTSSSWYQRVRTVDFMPVFGDFSISISNGFTFNAFWYTKPDESTYVGKIGAWSSSYNGNFYGYIRVVIRKGDGSQSFVPSAVTLQLTGKYGLVHNIVNLTNDVFGAIHLEMEQGGLSISQPYNIAPPTDANHYKRVRSKDYVRVNGEFTIKGADPMNLFLYDENKVYMGRLTDIEGGGWRTNEINYSHNGYFKLLAKKADDTDCNQGNFYFTLDNSLAKRLQDIENPITLSTSYLGERINVADNRFESSIFCRLPEGLSQCMAVYGDYVILFDYDSTKAIAKIYDLKPMSLIATLNLPNGAYMRPHCNSASFSNVVNTAESIMPLLYVSQWENNGQKCCFVYDFKYINGTYTVDLVQTILPTNVSTATRGAGQNDWVVDPMGYIYSIGYLLDNGAAVTTGNKTMVCKFTLPLISDGAVVTLGDADVLQNFAVEIYTARQDVMFSNGRIIMIVGSPANASHPLLPCRIVAINPTAEAVTAIVPIDYFNKEPEGIGIKDGYLLVGFRDDPILYKFNFS